MRFNRDEDCVYKHCARRGLEPRRTSPLEDAALHIDMTCNYGRERVGIDVKGPRRINRRDNEYSSDYTWLELRNRHGLRGSLFGKAKYLVIASPEGWLWVDRQELAIEAVLRYIENVNKGEPSTPWFTKHRGHSVIILCPFAFLYKVAASVWPCNYLQEQYNAKDSKE